ncbi:MAG: phosphatase PAP2 family protein [Bacteroidota bacterium]|nr:phosphatase PAP2 family protein [Bacteroidota bacterium]
MKWIVFYILLLVFSNSLYSQSDTSKYSFNGQFVKSCFTDLSNVVSSPVKWDGNQWISAGMIIAGTGLIYSQDQFFHDLTQRNQTKGLDNICKNFIEPWGSGVYSIPAMGALYCLGAFTSDQKEKKVALNAVKAFGIAGIVVLVPKYFIGRERPYEENGFAKPSSFKGPFMNYHASFPSGHTIGAFSLFTVIAESYKDKPIVVFTSYSLATLVGISRIYNNDHWASDVFFGAALGYGIGKLVVKNMNKPSNKIKANISLAPNYTGISMSYNIKYNNTK